MSDLEGESSSNTHDYSLHLVVQTHDKGSKENLRKMRERTFDDRGINMVYVCMYVCMYVCKYVNAVLKYLLSLKLSPYQRTL